MKYLALMMTTGGLVCMAIGGYVLYQQELHGGILAAGSGLIMWTFGLVFLETD